MIINPIKEKNTILTLLRLSAGTGTVYLSPQEEGRNTIIINHKSKVVTLVTSVTSVLHAGRLSDTVNDLVYPVTTLAMDKDIIMVLLSI